MGKISSLLNKKFGRVTLSIGTMTNTKSKLKPYENECKYEIKKNKTERFINDDSDPV